LAAASELASTVFDAELLVFRSMVCAHAQSPTLVASKARMQRRPTPRGARDVRSVAS
jgi:hypothetical protein